MLSYQIVALFRGCVNDSCESNLRWGIDETGVSKVDIRQKLVDVRPAKKPHRIRYSNHARYLNGGLKTGLKKACLWSKISGIQMVRQVM